MVIQGRIGTPAPNPYRLMGNLIYDDFFASPVQNVLYTKTQLYNIYIENPCLGTSSDQNIRIVKIAASILISLAVYLGYKSITVFKACMRDYRYCHCDIVSNAINRVSSAVAFFLGKKLPRVLGVLVFLNKIVSSSAAGVWIAIEYFDFFNQLLKVVMQVTGGILDALEGKKARHSATVVPPLKAAVSVASSRSASSTVYSEPFITVVVASPPPVPELARLSVCVTPVSAVQAV